MRMNKKLAGIVAAGAATALALGACASDEDGDTVSRGFEDCAENPNTCNSGERADGGRMIWTLDQAPDGYFPWSPEGGSVYTLQAIHGILPYFGQHMPNGDYEYNMDVLAGEPDQVSEDPFVTEWEIAEDAVWHDGTPITVEDVRLTWQMSTSEEEGYCEGCRPRSTSGADQIESIESLSDDGKQFQVTYKEGVAAPEWFAFMSAHNIVGGFVPAHWGEEQGFDVSDPAGRGEYFEYLNDNPPEFSGGPYMIEEFDLNTQVVKVPNPEWYGETEATLDELVIQFLDEEDTWVPALQNGELHGASPAGYGEDIIRQVQELDNVRVHIGSGPSWEHVDLNLDNEWLGEHQELRQAIFTVIDADNIADRNFGSLFPDYTLRTNHMFPQSSEYHENHLEGTGQGTGDVEMARQILQDAGFEGVDQGAGELTYDGETVGPFRLRSTSAPARATSMELIQAQLQEIGIEANIEVTDDLGGTLLDQDYDIMQFGWSGSPLFTGLGHQMWQSESNSNFGAYENEQVDELAEQEQQATSLDESAELHNQMVAQVVEDAYVLPLYDTPVYIFAHEDYVNVRDNPNTSLRALYEHHNWGEAVE